ncbi:MAG: ribonuclease P protein component [Sphingobacteriales bacterium]|nr:ribonuclease P protein component [Sphingobacteriales bacterium]
MATKIYSFKKEERLCSKKLLSELFNNGSSFLLYPFRVSWIYSSDPFQKFPIQVVIAVPKKRFKLSVDRNLIKRKIREAYRLNKQENLYLNLKEKKILLGLSYVGNQVHEFDYLEKKLLAAFKLLLKQMEQQ